MSGDYAAQRATTQATPRLAAQLQEHLTHFLTPFLHELDVHVDVRLVRTFLATIRAILVLRHRSYGLLLSELGGYLLNPAQAPAGTKRLSNLLRSPNWSSALITQLLWQHACTRIAELQHQDEEVLAIWDESVLEKAESSAGDGLCAVRSSKAARLKRIKPGFFNPPTGRPIQVPGLHWLGLLVLGHAGPPTVATMQ